MDHLRRKTLKLDEISMVVLDEADEMLNMGFREDIETILSQTPEERQTLLFSATMPQPIMEINSAHARDRDRYFFRVFFITFTFRCSFNNTTVL